MWKAAKHRFIGGVKGSEKHKLKQIKKSCGFYSYCLFLPFTLSCVAVWFIVFLFGKCWH